MNNLNVRKAAISVVLSTVFLALTVTQAWAQAKPKVEVTISSAKEVTVTRGGEEVAETIPADKVKPGEVMLYTIEYKNTGDGEAKDAAIVDPIPDNTVYVVGSAKGEGAEITCSIDGGKTYHTPPVKVTVTLPDGTKKEKDADPEEYTHIKWVVKSIPPGKSGTVEFKTKVE